MLSSNAPFNEKGFATVIRELERHELILNGTRQGDMGTSTGTNIGPLSVDQVTQEDGLGGSPLATMADLEAATANIPQVTYPIAVASGGTGSVTATTGLRALGGVSGRGVSLITATGAGSFVIPAGVNRIRIILVGAGGGIGGVSTSNNKLTVGYVASSSGGSPTVLFQLQAESTYGGAGGCAIYEIDVTPGSSVSYSVGAAGSAGTTGASGTSGSDGGNTAATYGSLTVTAIGGFGGRVADVGNANVCASGGYAYVSGGALSTYNGWMIGLKGENSARLVPWYGGGSGWLQPLPLGFDLQGLFTGGGGIYGSASEPGAILFMY